MSDTEIIDVSLALCELTTEFNRIEGALLSAGGRENTVTPEWLANRSGIQQSTCEDILLQLRRINAVERAQVETVQYTIRPEKIRECFSMARKSGKVVETYESRHPGHTDVTPLVTLPADPSFGSVTPEEFGMQWLMPSLGRLIKQADSKITVLTPFFEEDGFEQLHQPLLGAIEKGVDVTIITRYLQDSDSHNRAVIEAFTDRCRERNLSQQRLSLVDYTVWSEETESQNRTQDGNTPLFTLHAKLLIVDQNKGYIGSANVTDYGFERYLELGAILEGPAIIPYSNLVEFLLQSDAAAECYL